MRYLLTIEIEIVIFLDCSTLIELKQHLLLNKIRTVLLMLLILFTVDPNSSTIANVGLLISNVRFCVINSIILVFPQFAERRPNFLFLFEPQSKLQYTDHTKYTVYNFQVRHPRCVVQKDMIYIWYDIHMYDMYLIAIGLTAGGSSTVHTYTQTIHRTTQSTQTIHRTTQFTNQEECRPCPIFVRYTLAFALQLREKHEITKYMGNIQSNNLFNVLMTKMFLHCFSQ